MNRISLDEKQKIKGESRRCLVVTKRDIDMLRFTGEQKFVTVEQLAKRFFPSEVGRTGRTCYRRILKLKRYSLVESRTARLGGKVVYQVASRGVHELIRRDGWALPYLGRVDGRHFEHDLYLSDVRIALEKLGVKPWLSERVLRKKGYAGHVPDALLKLGNRKCALELELTQKRKDRYRTMFKESLRHHLDLDLVWYLASTNSIEKAVHQQAKAVGDRRRYVVSDFRGFMRDPLSTRLVGADDSFVLGDIL